jgi:hypothetical protein
MKPIITLISLSTILLCLAASLAAQQPRSTEEWFKRLDRNGDRKLTHEELANNPWLLERFDAADVNKDGALSFQELRAVLPGGTRPVVPARTPTAPTASSEQKTRHVTHENAIFEPVDVPGFTDVRGEANGLAFADLNRDGLLDIVRATKTGITVLLNSGGFRFERQPIKVRNQNGSEGRVTPGAEIPNLVDFNKDGYLDIFITTSGGRGQYAKRIGNNGNQLLVSDGSPFSFVDVSDQMHIRNADGWNRQSSIADVNRDGWLDIAIGSDNISDGRAGLPHSRLYVFQPKGVKFEDGTFEDIGGTDLVPDFGGLYGNPDKDRAGPGIVLRDLDNDGDFDLVQGYHMDTHGRIDGEYPVALYDYGVFCWDNLFAETGRFRFERIKDNGLAQRGKLKFRAPFDYDVAEPAVARPGGSYLRRWDGVIPSADRDVAIPIEDGIEIRLTAGRLEVGEEGQLADELVVGGVGHGWARS